MPYFNFVTTLRGQGKTPEEAWDDAVAHLSEDPGEMPDEFYEDDEVDEEEEEEEEEEED